MNIKRILGCILAVLGIGFLFFGIPLLNGEGLGFCFKVIGGIAGIFIFSILLGYLFGLDKKGKEDED
jgi:hypothetical protein